MYTSFCNIPYRIFNKILQTEKHFLLCGTEAVPEQFNNEQREAYRKAWISLYSEYLAAYPDKAPENTIKIIAAISALRAKYKAVFMLCKALEFNDDAEYLMLMTEMGFHIPTNSSAEYLEAVKALITKSNYVLNEVLKLEDKLKEDRISKLGYETEKYSVDEMLSSLETITGNKFSYDQITVGQTMTLQNQALEIIQEIENLKLPR